MIDRYSTCCDLSLWVAFTVFKVSLSQTLWPSCGSLVVNVSRQVSVLTDLVCQALLESVLRTNVAYKHEIDGGRVNLH